MKITHTDKGHGKDSVGAVNLPSVYDHIRYRTDWKIEKFANDEAFKNGQSYETVDVAGNMLLNEGINGLLTTLLAGGAATALSNANSYLGVGDSNTAEAASQTGLQAASNKLYKAMNATYPQYGTNQQIIFQADFTGAEANFSWQEFTVANGNSDASVNLNRKISNQGTKTSGQTWRLTLTITFS